MTTDTTLSTFVAADGDNVAIQDWPLEQGSRLRGVVILVHGLGEHAGRYDHVARKLNDWGFAVRGYDQYGHGESGGPRGGLPTDNRLLDDLADVVDSTRARMDPETPLILLGHSMGGLVVGRFVSLAMRPVEALIMSSPALDPGLSAVQKLLVSVLPKIAPNLRVGNGLDASLISHDPAVVAAYQSDRLVHDRISGRLARFIAQEGAATVALAPRWKVPTLLIYAGSDKLVNPAGSRAFAAAAPKEVVNAHCFESLYHEIFNELNAEPVFAELKRWLDARF
ncbi:alpha/beta hydrolase [Rhodoferax sp.]|uniref:alpha/beta hydrolase n=1 Tax=Rhodoferax sp. TaxID=50421 RepID=UPI001EC883A4|nr:alpha/beta hydrolase [Rhodoferax sp.]MBT9505114.1 lysophospholipase [Rhodoferax sp.]